MQLNHNAAALSALNTMRKNDSELSKALKKASSGMKINGASDGASEYSIGSKMDVMIRSLDQDRVNSETGRNLVAVAAGGIQEIINNIRSMKELAINAANDHNTDADRETIQKEFSSRMQTISDIAAETNYNGRYLLNGSYYEPLWLDIDGQYGLTTNSLQLFPVNAGDRLSYRQETWASGRDGFITPYLETNTVLYDGSLDEYELYGTEINFPNVSPEEYDNQGFIVICNVGGSVHGFASVKFTYDLELNTAEVIYNAQGGSDGARPEYLIGIAGAIDYKDIEDSLYNSIKSLNQSNVKWRENSVGGSNDQALLTPAGHEMNVEKDSSGKYTLVQESWPMWIYNGSLHDQTGLTTGYVEDKKGNPLIIHTGPKQNQELRVFINSMSPIAMGLNKASVTTTLKARAAMHFCEKALNYALNENTRMGAYMSRLEFTKENLVTAHENVTAAKSTIMDADMAATMAEFHKQNVLTQSAQFMLAQANQNSSSVLSLLQ